MADEIVRAVQPPPDDTDTSDADDDDQLDRGYGARRPLAHEVWGDRQQQNEQDEVRDNGDGGINGQNDDIRQEIVANAPPLNEQEVYHLTDEQADQEIERLRQEVKALKKQLPQKDQRLIKDYKEINRSRESRGDNPGTAPPDTTDRSARRKKTVKRRPRYTSSESEPTSSEDEGEIG